MKHIIQCSRTNIYNKNAENKAVRTYMKIFDSISFGKKIKERRKSLGYTQEQLSENSGISMSFISDLENGKPTCELNKAIIIAKLLSMDIYIENRGESQYR